MAQIPVVGQFRLVYLVFNSLDALLCQARQIDCFRNVARVLALDYQIKAINPELSAFAGAALTCYASPDDSLAILAAFEIAQPGDVIVAATEAFKGSAVVGDLFAAMAVSAAVSAIVTDGLARDCDGIIATGLPVFASGISPNSAAQSGPGTVGLPVVISGVRTAPGALPLTSGCLLPLWEI